MSWHTAARPSDGDYDPRASDPLERARSVRPVRVGKAHVDADFGAGVTPLGRLIQVLDLRPGKGCRVPVDGPVRWDALHALPHLLTVMWAGPDRGIIEAVAAHPSIKFLYW